MKTEDKLCLAWHKIPNPLTKKKATHKGGINNHKHHDFMGVLKSSLTLVQRQQ